MKKKRNQKQKDEIKKSYIQIRIEGINSKQIKLNKRSKNQKIKKYEHGF